MGKRKTETPTMFTRLLNRVGFESQAQIDERVDRVSKEFEAELAAMEEPAPSRDRDPMHQWDMQKDLTQKDLLEAALYDVWYSSAIFVIQSAIAQLPWKITKKVVTSDGETRKEVVTDCESYKLLDDPNPKEDYTWFDLMEGTANYLEGVGEGYWLLFNKMRRKKADDRYYIKILRPDKMKAVIDEAGLKEWTYTPNPEDEKTKKPYPVGNIIQFKYFNPLDAFSGLASGVPCWESILTDRALRRVNRVRVENYFKPAKTVEFDADAPYTDEHRKELQRKLQTRAKPKYAGETRVLPPGAHVNDKADEPDDMEYNKLQDAIIQEVSAATGVPAALMGKSGEFNRANINALLYILYELTIRPKTRKIAAKINLRIVKKFDPEQYENEHLRFEFDFSAVEALKQDPMKAAQAARLLTGRAVKTVNEWRDDSGIEGHPQKDADELYVKPTSPLPHTPEMEPEIDTREQKAHLASASLPPYLSYTELFDEAKVDKDRAEDNPDGYQLWVIAMEQVAPVEKRIIAKIHRMARQQRDTILDILDRTWKKLEDEGKVTEVPVSKVYQNFRKAPPIIPMDDFEALMADLAEQLEEQGEWMVELLTPELESALLKGADFGAGVVVTGFDFSMRSRTVKGWKKETGKRITTEIPKTTLSQFQASLYKGYKLGEGIRELKQRVKDQLGHLVGTGDYRAELIARTETMSAFNFGAVESYRQAKVDGTKIWLAAFDDRVRDWHADVEPAIGLKSAFMVNGPSGTVEMMYPGDPVGGGENVCNCRCVVSLIPKE